MSEIRILPDDVSNRIAAGEVIERPASVVKELVENAVDAHADRITVRAEEGGRRLIQVTDNGQGMDTEDAMLALEPHATSKIENSYDIDRIQTLGFRGEALPSIAAVSRFQLETRRPDKESGMEIVVNGGKIQDAKECGCAPGTNLLVRNLFFNVPARRKFLRKAETEASHIQETVLLHALAHRDIALDLTLDNKKILQTRGRTDMSTRIAMLLGRDVLRAMLPVDYTEDEVRVEGFAARPGFTRKNRREQRLFVNGRPAESSDLYNGIRDAYHTLVMKGRYPPVILYIWVNSDSVDVNVHPAKREVRFQRGRMIRQIVAAAVRRALQETAHLQVPEQPESAGMPASGADDSRAGEGRSQASATAGTQNTQAENRQKEGTSEENSGEVEAKQQKEFLPEASPQKSAPEPPSPQKRQNEPEPRVPENSEQNLASQQKEEQGTSPSAATSSEIKSLQVLGFFNIEYLVAEGNSGLVLIDQHAAHERILFEKLLADAKEEKAQMQQLLMPATVELGQQDARLLEKHVDAFAKIGFGIEHFGGNAFIVNGVPPYCQQENITGLLQNMLDELRENATSTPQFEQEEIMVAQAACKNAVKASSELKEEEIEHLLGALAEVDMPFTCPHGRPVMINFPHKEIEKRFGRRS